jgi:NO-binding membrane sensor protein with MHYT domain
MHFIGMLADYLPVSIAYNLPIVIVSKTVKIFAFVGELVFF